MSEHEEADWKPTISGVYFDPQVYGVELGGQLGFHISVNGGDIDAVIREYDEKMMTVCRAEALLMESEWLCVDCQQSEAFCRCDYCPQCGQHWVMCPCDDDEE